MVGLYAILVRLLLPLPFRQEYGAELKEAVRSRLSSAGGAGRLWCFLSELLDLAVTAGREWGVLVRERFAAGADGRRSRAPGTAASLVQDARHAFRQMLGAPGFSLLVVGTLGLGIGMNTAVFSVVHTLLLRPLPAVSEPERLVELERRFPGIGNGANSIPHYRDLQARGAALFEGVAAWSFVTVGLETGGRTDVAVGQMVSANFFDVLGVRARLGRTFVPEEAEGVGAHPVVVLSHEAWRSRFGGDPDVIGRAVEVNGVAFEVVGVAPEGFRGVRPLYAPVLWAPLSMQPWLQPGRADRLENRSSNFLGVVARMRPGATLEVTRAGVDALFAGLLEDYPDVYAGGGLHVSPQGIGGLGERGSGAIDRLAVVLMLVVSVLLVLACANVANLMLVRGETRRRELAIRLSIGATRSRVVRQLMTESLMFAVVAGTAGLAAAAVTVRLFATTTPPTAVPLSVTFGVDRTVLAYTFAVSVGTAFLFGVAPALEAVRTAAAGRLAHATARGRRGSPIIPALVVLQSALAVVLLAGAGLFLRSLSEATRIDPGFGVDGLLTARVHPDLAGRERAGAEAYMAAAAERLSALPGIARVSWADVLPLSPSGQSTRVSLPGHVGAGDDPMSFDYARVGPGYFETMGIPVMRGRGIARTDDAAAAPVVVVNETLAAMLWPGADPIGRILEVQGESRTVAGVVANGKYRNLGESGLPYLYLAHAQDFRQNLHLLIRTEPGARGVPAHVMRVLGEIDPAVPVRAVAAAEAGLETSLFAARSSAAAFALFGILGLVLSTAGIYGVTAQNVSRQTRDIGIRIALGANRARVLRMVIGRGAVLTGTGIGIGLLLSVGVARLAQGLLYSPAAVDPLVFLTVPALLGAVGLLALAVPAMRAARMNPVRAIRSE